MDFSLDAEQIALRDTVRGVLRDRPVLLTTGPPEHDVELWSALADLGALGLPFAESVGGLGAGPVEVMLVAVELGRAGRRSAYADVLAAGMLVADTDPDLVGAVAEGSALAVAALTEPRRAWSPDPAQVVDVGGSLDGVREPVPYAAAASHVVTTALVADHIGIYLIANPDCRDGRLDLAGADARRLGSGDGRPRVSAAVNLAALVVCAESLGAMEAALDMTVGYLRIRKQFGVPLASFQALTHRAAGLYADLELARSTVLYAAMALADNPLDEDTVSRLKVVTGRAGRRIGQEAIQLHGGIGMTAEYGVGHLAARLTALEHSFGDTRFHLGRLAGRAGRPARGSRPGGCPRLSVRLAGRLGDHDRVDVLA